MLLASVGFQILEQHERNAGFAPFAGEFRRDVSIPAGATAGSAEHDIQIAIAVDVSGVHCEPSTGRAFGERGGIEVQITMVFERPQVTGGANGFRGHFALGDPFRAEESFREFGI